MDSRWDAYGDTVLYDVFYEAGTYLGGVLVALWRKYESSDHITLAQQARDEALRLDAERASVRSDDREDQIRHIIAWRARAEELAKQLDLATV